MSDLEDDFDIEYRPNTPGIVESTVALGLDAVTAGAAGFQNALGGGWFCTLLHKDTEVKVWEYGDTKNEALHKALGKMEAALEAHAEMESELREEAQRRERGAHRQRTLVNGSGQLVQRLIGAKPSSDGDDPFNIKLVFGLMALLAVCAIVYYVVLFVVKILIPTLVMAAPAVLIVMAWFRKGAKRTWMASFAFTVAILVYFDHLHGGILSGPYSRMGGSFASIAFTLYICAVWSGVNALGFLIYALIQWRKPTTDPLLLSKRKWWLVGSMTVLALGVIFIHDVMAYRVPEEKHTAQRDEAPAAMIPSIPPKPKPQDLSSIDQGLTASTRTSDPLSTPIDPHTTAQTSTSLSEPKDLWTNRETDIKAASTPTATTLSSAEVKASRSGTTHSAASDPGQDILVQQTPITDGAQLRQHSINIGGTPIWTIDIYGRSLQGQPPVPDAAGKSGYVVLRFTVAPTGEVLDIIPDRNRSNTLDPQLWNKAITSAKRCVFVPTPEANLPTTGSMFFRFGKHE
ncbi:MAG: hypothetical protein IPI81_07735 [Flavobacteriales bacterium]|nr:hypothetical protein [Flavobacteriales bacterium]